MLDNYDFFMYDYIIVGAGVSGIFTSYLLKEKNKKLLLIEKNNYLGGRSAKRKAKDWGWIDKEDILPYGPHIIPTGGELEKLLDKFNIKKRKLRMPIFIFNKNEFWDFNNFLSLFFLFINTKTISFIEKINLIKMILKISIMNEEDLINNYNNINAFELLRRFNFKSIKIMDIFRIITGSYCFNDDLKTCPALDLTMNIKLAAKSIIKKGTIMFDADYNDLYNSLTKVIGKENIILDKKVLKIIEGENGVKGVILSDGKKIDAKNIIFTGHPIILGNILKNSKIKNDFIKNYYELKPAVLIDIIIQTKKKLFDYNTDWLTIYENDKIYTIIKEDELYHCCVILYNKKISKNELIKNMKKDIKTILKYDIDQNPEWKVIVEMIGHNVERNIILPFYKRMGPKTPIKGLYCVGESYKTIYTGTEGCLYSAIDFIKIIK